MADLLFDFQVLKYFIVILYDSLYRFMDMIAQYLGIRKPIFIDNFSVCAKF